MSKSHSHHVTANRGDPTGTKTLRDQFGRQLTKRYRALKGLIYQGVGRDDRLGLADRRSDGTRDTRAPGDFGGQDRTPGGGDGDPPRKIGDKDDYIPRPQPTAVPDADALPPDITTRPYDFPSDEAKIMYFNTWIEQAQDDLIQQGRKLPANQWGSQYTAFAYEQSIEQASEFLNEVGVEVPKVSIRDTFRMPVHQNTLERLYIRQYDALEGLKADTGRELSRILVEGFGEGLNPRTMARALNKRIDAVSIRRAETIARTEVIRAHNEAALSRYEEIMGSNVEVTVVAEFQTAGDNRVCEVCAGLEGRRFSLKEARNFIPGNTHPNCRCTWVPVTDATADENRPAAPGGGLGGPTGFE